MHNQRLNSALAMQVKKVEELLEYVGFLSNDSKITSEGFDEIKYYVQIDSETPPQNLKTFWDQIEKEQRLGILTLLRHLEDRKYRITALEKSLKVFKKVGLDSEVLDRPKDFLENDSYETSLKRELNIMNNRKNSIV